MVSFSFPVPLEVFLENHLIKDKDSVISPQFFLMILSSKLTRTSFAGSQNSQGHLLKNVFPRITRDFPLFKRHFISWLFWPLWAKIVLKATITLSEKRAD